MSLAVSSLAPLQSPNLIASPIDDLFIHASKAEDLVAKRGFYERIFQILKFEPISPVHFRLFEEYASKTCYAQTEGEDDEAGFRKCARLLELSFCLQLTYLGLGDHPYDLKAQNSLEDLITSLQKGTAGHFSDILTELNMSGDVLAQKSGDAGIKELVAKTLIKLTFSYQNITGYKDYAFHKRFNDLTEKVIGDETEKEKETLIDYCYNRCAFLTQLRSPGDLQAQADSYNPILAQLEKLFSEDSTFRMSLTAQIANMQGLLIIRSGGSVDQAKPFFFDAMTVREALDKRYQDPEKGAHNAYLLANIRTGVVHCLVKSKPTEESVAQARVQAEKLRAYINETERLSQHHAYRASWIGAAKKAEDFVSQAEQEAAGSSHS